MSEKVATSTISKSVHVDICRRAALVALIVGTVLNFINQGDAILGDGKVDLAKLFLTYLVPFFVSAHGAVSVRRAQKPFTRNSSGTLA